MRVALDAQLALGTATGIGEFVSGLGPALERLGIEVVPLRAARLDPWRFDRRVLWDQVILPFAARRAHADVLHCASGTMPLLAPHATVVTVHDLAWQRVQQHTPAYARAYFGAFSLARYARAARVVVDSEFSERELLALSRVEPARVSVVYPGVAADICALQRRPQAEPFALVAGTIEPRKKLEVVVRAMRAVGGLRVIAVGPATPYKDEIERLAHALGVADRLEMPGYVSRATLLDLYARATLAAMPSSYEGFGYGAAQALCAGVPLLAADAASLPEVAAGTPARLLPTGDAIAWEHALRALLDDRDRAQAAANSARAAAIARFSWDRCAKQMSAVYSLALKDC